MYTKAKGKRGVSFNTIQKNTRLVDFSGIKDIVIANSVREVPDMLKSEEISQDQKLSYFF